ncbi:Zn(II)2Cys6 transcription factor domain-containing protein [Aspergillus stella-maris]|uniref:Zn(II)2Cys6 transcription factor domain-containing protein n=1 Tax=Aspergillus stella-maris TaxID=1810926 RepID=UPI003CCCD929
MGDTRRKQNHSCDPCRKGKRGCDAPETRIEGYTCSNCRRWKKQCTFNWVASRRTAPGAKHPRSRTKPNNATAAPSIPSVAPAIVTPDSGDIHALLSSYNSILDEGLLSYQPYPFPFTDPPNLPSSASANVDATQDIPWNLDLSNNWQTSNLPAKFNRFLSPLSSHLSLNPLQQLNTYDTIEQLPAPSSTSSDDTTSSDSPFQWSLCIASDKTAQQFARSTMSRNLIRIYHDSMENALSCWLTEHNCPYSDEINYFLPPRQIKEWGPSWSNRMCVRVCKLDRVSTSLRGRALSAEEDRTAAKALHLAIVAFASQWTQHAQSGTALSVPQDITVGERSIRKNTWNEARHALQHCTGIPSFRVIFANVIFSLTQAPLDGGPNASLALGQLLDNDGAPVFLETANRQLYTFRHKFARLQREAPPSVREMPRRGSTASTLTEIFDVPPTPSESVTAQVDPILANQDHRSTLSLLFWLGIMFDTLSSAMYQRPLVVSDEDSQITSAPSPSLDPDLNLGPETPINLDCWELPPYNRNDSRDQNDVWGDLFLRTSHSRELQYPSTQTHQHRWPCTYEQAASTLSKATPVKVLLYRRVTQLQTLIYRGASPARLEAAIQRALSVYNHWTSTYQPFMLDCVMNHDKLPSRIQSWYVILDGHWHLAALLLADVLESIDRSNLGTESGQRERISSDLISTLRIENALAVGGLARSSLTYDQGKCNLSQHFHDSLNEVAFLVEPWTVVLIHSFAKAAYISLEYVDVYDIPGYGNKEIEQDGTEVAGAFAQNCHYCICALRYLGRKSDMASMVARDLTRGLEGKVGGLV